MWGFLWACELKRWNGVAITFVLERAALGMADGALAGKMMGLLGIPRGQETALQKGALARLPAGAGKLAELAELVGWVRRRGQRGCNELSVLRVVARDAYSHVHRLQSRFKPFIPTSAVAGAKNYAELRTILRYSAIAVIAGVLPREKSKTPVTGDFDTDSPSYRPTASIAAP